MPTAALALLAYIGPGMGLGTIIVVLIILALVLFSFAYVLWVPLKKAFRRARGRNDVAERERE